MSHQGDSLNVLFVLIRQMTHGELTACRCPVNYPSSPITWCERIYYCYLRIQWNVTHETVPCDLSQRPLSCSSIHATDSMCLCENLFFISYWCDVLSSVLLELSYDCVLYCARLVKWIKATNLFTKCYSCDLLKVRFVPFRFILIGVLLES